MDRLLIDISQTQDTQAFAAACDRLGIVRAFKLEEGLVKLEFSDQYKERQNDEMDAYVIRTLSNFGHVSRCQ